ncbi:ZPR1 zinc finger domain-containing protein [Methanobrevibacter sp. DSM 116169]|uniref:ZPR1 zinc finger domain-containing protein n=1 Tax=Methanobrevibacter sp. DSM 116169 TaxID=3242727 RepID=UPI0038FBE810
MIVVCPACHEKGAKSVMKEIEIPHFGKVLETTILCDKCNYKHNDVIALEHNDPAKYELDITNETISSRVVRSQSATVSIPELGLKVEPGPKSEGYVSNVEGVITRFEDAVKRALKLFCDGESLENAEKILIKLEELKEGKIKAKLIIEDPFGQSNIVSPDTITTPLSEEELKNLKTGFTIIEE